MPPEEIIELAAALSYEAGRRAQEREDAERWAALREKVRRGRTRAEHQALDAAYAAGEPCPARCDRCSRCIRAAVIARHGGDYSGGPVAWEEP